MKNPFLYYTNIKICINPDLRITIYITYLTVCSKITIDCSGTIQECISIICNTSINNLHIEFTYANKMHIMRCLNIINNFCFITFNNYHVVRLH